MSRKINEIAKEIRETWANVHFTAEPYLSAMETLVDTKSMYHYEDGRTIVLYFLSNSFTFRGEVARRIKQELKELIK